MSLIAKCNVLDDSDVGCWPIADEDDGDDAPCVFNAASPLGHIAAQCGGSVSSLQSLYRFLSNPFPACCVLVASLEELVDSPLILGFLLPFPYLSLVFSFLLDAC